MLPTTGNSPICRGLFNVTLLACGCLSKRAMRYRAYRNSTYYRIRYAYMRGIFQCMHIYRCWKIHVWSIWNISSLLTQQHASKQPPQRSCMMSTLVMPYVTSSVTIPIKLIREHLSVDIVKTYMNVSNNRQLTDIVAFSMLHCSLVAACSSMLWGTVHTKTQHTIW